jgi:NADH:ubiquinone oxidoreductase subunit D
MNQNILTTQIETSSETGIRTEEMLLNVGPQHPSTHGVFRLVVKIDGETIKEAIPVMGYLHRGTEKLAENLTYTQIIPYTDRMDYVSAMTNNYVLCHAVETMMGLEIPERAQFLRLIAMELNRVASHLVWWGTYLLDIGAMGPFLYAFRDREMILDLFNELCGARMTFNYMRIGFEFDVPTATDGDCMARYQLRMAEIEQSLHILEQALDQFPSEGEVLGKVPRVIRPPAGETYVRIESPRGEIGCYIASQGKDKPWRLKFRRPSFTNLQILPKLLEGESIANMIAILGSIDIVLGEVDC